MNKPTPPNDFKTDSDLNTRKITVTFIKDETGQHMARHDMTLPELAAHIKSQTAASKMELPWLKLALFGNRRSEKNSLRTNANVLQVVGIEAEHDEGTVSFEEAVAILHKAAVRCIVYSSPSYAPGIKEKWRMLAPLSVTYPPETREKLVARIKGLFAGEITDESFTLSQGFLYGHVEGAEHRVEVLDGRHLDVCNELYAGSIFKDGSRVGDKAGGNTTSDAGTRTHSDRRQSSSSGDDTEGGKAADWQPLIGHILAGKPLHTSLRDLAAKLVTSGTSAGTVVNLLRALLENSSSPRDLRWMERFSSIPGLVDSAEQFRGATDAPGSATPIELKATPYVWRDPQAIPKRQFLYGTHLIRKFGSAKFAAGGVGKSALALTEAIAMATGRALLGVVPRQRCRVWYWNGEDPREETERRIAAICLHYGITAEEVEGWLFYDSGRDQPIVIAEQTKTGSIIAKPVVEALIKAITDDKIDVLIIDPFVSCHRIVENDNPAMDMVAKKWTAIADETNTAIELIHHTKKTGGADATVEDGRGAVALLAAVRSAQVLNKMTPEEGNKAGIDNRRLYFKVENGKANLAPPPEGKDWYHLVGVALGNGDGGLLDTGDNVGVVTAWAWPNPLDGITGPDFDRAAYEIRKGRWRESSQAKDWVGWPIAKALGLDLHGSKSEKAKVTGLIKIWISTGSLVVVEDLDDKSMPRKFVQVAEDEE